MVFFLPHLEGLLCLKSCTHENSKETVRLGVLYPFSERIKADFNSQLQKSRQELKPLQGISVVSFLQFTQILPPSRSTPYGFARLELTVKTFQPMVSQLSVSQIILEATFGLKQTLMRLSLGSGGGVLFSPSGWTYVTKLSHV